MKLSWPNLTRRETHTPELMDDPACNLRKLERTYAQFEQVNALVSGWWPVYLRDIRPRLRRERANTLLDIGCGGGDLARQLLGWAARDGFSLRVLGIDTDARAIHYAQRQLYSGLEFRAVGSRELLVEGAKFDFIVSNHVLHHLSDTELTTLLADCQALSSGITLHSDIERHPLAYAGFGLLAAPLFHDSFILPDGLLSVRRSFTKAELSRLAPAGWQVTRPFPFRLLLSREAGRA